MNAAAFLESLRDRDIRVWVEGDRLRCDGPPGSLTPELREALRAAKGALLEFLQAAQCLAGQSQALIPLTAWNGPNGSNVDSPILFGIGGHNGDVFCFRGLARQLGPAQPFYGLQPPGADGLGEPLTQVEALAAYFLEQIRSIQPSGPYHLIGYCAGGAIAFELAHQLRRLGASVALLALVGSPHPHQFRRLPKLRRKLRGQWQRLAKHAVGLGAGSLADRRRYVADALAEHRARQQEETLAASDPALVARSRLEHITLQALARYEMKIYEGPMVLFMPSRAWTAPGGLAARWPQAALSVEEHFGPEGSDGDTMLRDQHAEAFATLFRHCLESQTQSAFSAIRSVAPPTRSFADERSTSASTSGPTAEPA